MSRRKRKPELSLLNVLFCFFVVWIHLLSEPVTAIASDTPAWYIAYFVQRILFCAIYGFIFLSAVKSFLPNPEEKNISAAMSDTAYTRTIAYYKNRFLRIVLPYWIAGTVYWAVFYLTGIQRTAPLAAIGQLLSGSGAAHFYFTIVIVQFYALYPLIQRLVQRQSAGRLLIAAAVLNLLTAVCFYRYAFYNRLFTRYLFCYIAGALFGTHYDRVRSVLYPYRKWIFILYPIVQGLECAGAYAVRTGRLHPLPGQLITQICMPLLVLFWYCLVMNASCPAPLRAADRAAYSVYLWHVLFIALADLVIGDIGGTALRMILRSGIVCCAIFILICLSSALRHYFRKETPV